MRYQRHDDEGGRRLHNVTGFWILEMAHVTRAQLIKNTKRTNMWRWLSRQRDIPTFVHDCTFFTFIIRN